MTSRSDARDLDAFLAEHGDEQALTALAESLPAASAPAELRARVLASARVEGRFARFVEPIAELLDLPLQQAQAALDALSLPSSFSPGFVPGMELCHVRGGPRVASAITGFVRLASGVTFPEHEHLGAESVLVLQGRCRDGERVVGPGERLDMPAGSSHSFTVLPGPDFLYLAVLHTGLRMGELVLDAADPRA